MAKSKSDISLNDLKAMLPQEGSIAEQEAALRALTTLSQEDRNLLAAVQESPYRLTTLEQFREFPANTEYFILESRVNKLDTLGWRYLFEHTDIVFPDEWQIRHAGGTGLFYQQGLFNAVRGRVAA